RPARLAHEHLGDGADLPPRDARRPPGRRLPRAAHPRAARALRHLARHAAGRGERRRGLRAGGRRLPPGAGMTRGRRAAAAAVRWMLRAALLLLALWCAAALWIDGPAWRWLAGLLAAACVGVSLAFLFRRPAWRNLPLALLPCLLVLGWWFTLQPRNDR